MASPDFSSNPSRTGNPSATTNLDDLSIPIALKMGGRSFIYHPLCSFVFSFISYLCFSIVFCVCA